MEQTKPTTRAEEIAGDGPYKVERKDSQMATLWDIVGHTSTDKWYSSEGEAERECKHLNAAYKHGQQDRWPHHLTEENIDTMAQFIAGQLDNDGHHNRYDAAKKALTMYRDHILTP